MAVRLKKLHDAAQFRYNKHRDWLAKAVADEAPAAGPFQFLSSRLYAVPQDLPGYKVCDEFICDGITVYAVLC